MTKNQDCYEKFSLLYREMVLKWFVKTELENKRVAQLSLLTDPKTFQEYYTAFLTERGFNEKDRAEQVNAFLTTEFGKFKRYLWQIHGEMFVAGVICDAGANSGKFLNQFRLTAAGERSIAEQDPSPVFADQYLAELKKNIPSLDTLVESYLSEALQSLNRQMPLASAMMLDAASERLFLLLSIASPTVTRMTSSAPSACCRSTPRWSNCAHNFSRNGKPTSRRTPIISSAACCPRTSTTRKPTRSSGTLRRPCAWIARWACPRSKVR